MYRLELLHHYVGGKQSIEAKGLKSLFKKLTGYNFKRVVRSTSDFLKEMEGEISYFAEVETAKTMLKRELDFCNSNFWIKHKEADFFSNSNSSLEDFLSNILNNEIFFDYIGYKNIKLNNLPLHNQGVIVVTKGYQIKKLGA